MNWFDKSKPEKGVRLGKVVRCCCFINQSIKIYLQFRNNYKTNTNI